MLHVHEHACSWAQYHTGTRVLVRMMSCDAGCFKDIGVADAHGVWGQPTECQKYMGHQQAVRPEI